MWERVEARKEDAREVVRHRSCIRCLIRGKGCYDSVMRAQHA